MSRKHDIIDELEAEVGETLDENFEPEANGLCNGDTCRHAECSCWDSFRSAVEEQLVKQKAEWVAGLASMKALYDGEVKAGIHVPAYEREIA